MTRPHATQPGSAADARRLLAGLPEGATLGPWRKCGANEGNCSCLLVWGPDAPVAKAVTSKDESITGGEGYIEAVAQKNAYLLAAAPDLRDALTAALDREAELRALLIKARPLLSHVPYSLGGVRPEGVCAEIDALLNPGAPHAPHAP